LRKLVSLVAASLVICFLAATASMAADRVTTRVGPAWNEAWSRTQIPSGAIEDVTLSNGTTTCCRFTGCNPPSDPNFNVGATVTIDSYWQETIPASPNFTVQFTAGFKAPGRPVVKVFDNDPVGFGSLAAGNYTFCVSYDVGPIPPGAAGVQDVATGFGVQTPGGTIPPAPYQTVDVNP
jgi:hypothetical protein